MSSPPAGAGLWWLVPLWLVMTALAFTVTVALAASMIYQALSRTRRRPPTAAPPAAATAMVSPGSRR
jgi:hypothetical protein